MHASTPTSPRQPGFPLIDALLLPFSASVQCRPRPLPNHKGLFVCNLWISVWFGLREEREGQQAEWRHRNRKRSEPSLPAHFSAHLISWIVKRAFVYYSRLAVGASFGDGEGEIETRVVIIERFSVFLFFPLFAPPLAETWHHVWQSRDNRCQSVSGRQIRRLLSCENRKIWCSLLSLHLYNFAQPPTPPFWNALSAIHWLPFALFHQVVLFTLSSLNGTWRCTKLWPGSLTEKQKPSFLSSPGLFSLPLIWFLSFSSLFPVFRSPACIPNGFSSPRGVFSFFFLPFYWPSFLSSFLPSFFPLPKSKSHFEVHGESEGGLLIAKADVPPPTPKNFLASNMQLLAGGTGVLLSPMSHSLLSPTTTSVIPIHPHAIPSLLSIIAARDPPSQLFYAIDRLPKNRALYSLVQWPNSDFISFSRWRSVFDSSDVCVIARTGPGLRDLRSLIAVGSHLSPSEVCGGKSPGSC